MSVVVATVVELTVVATVVEPTVVATVVEAVDAPEKVEISHIRDCAEDRNSHLLCQDLSLEWMQHLSPSS